MKTPNSSLPPELAGLFDEARRGAPTPAPALQQRVLARVEATVAALPNGSGGSTLAGTVAKGGLALLLALGGGYAGFKALGASAPQPAVRLMATTTDVAKPLPAPFDVVSTQNESAPEAEMLTAPATVPVAVEESARRHMPRRPRRATRVERLDTLALEEAILEKARAQLPGNPQQVLRLLDQHASRFPQGQLVEERDLLRARAHIANGDSASASDVARRFLERHPHSVNRREMEKLWEKH